MNHLLLHFRAVLVPALKHFYDSIGVGTTIKTTLLPFEGSTDIPDLTTIYESTNYSTLMLPLHPDVVIHYRCSDNINFKWMGLTQFHTILNLIPTDSRYIIILTEGTPLGLAIISALRKRILAKFPSLEQVLIRHGGSVFSPIVSFLHAKTVICSASTFCFYFATSNIHGKVYMPTRPFYGSPWSMYNFQVLREQWPVYRWFYPNGSHMDTDYQNWPKALKNDHAYIKQRALEMVEVLENLTYAKVVIQGK